MSLPAGIPEVLRASRYKGEVEYFDEDDHVWRTMPPEKKLVPPHIKPIETKFRGYRFRSRLEARWAVYFDAMGMAWEYEKEGYDLGEAGWYLPDFWLPELNAWGEVKAKEPNHIEERKAKALCEATHAPLIWLIGVPEERDRCYRNLYPIGYFGRFEEYKCKAFPDTEYEFLAKECPLPHTAMSRGVCPDCDFQKWITELGNPKRVLNFNCDPKGVTAARSARFEHGESP